MQIEMIQEDSKKYNPVLILAYLRYSDLFPDIKPRIRDLQSRLNNFDMLETILILSKINLLFSDIKNPFDPPLQIYLAKWFLNEYTLDRLQKKYDKYTLIFHRHQILYILKNAFLSCNDMPKRSFEISQLRFKRGTCLLIANDLLGIQNLDKENLNRQQTDKKKELLWKESLPGWELNNPAEYMLVIARMRKIFKKIAPSFKENPSFFDMDDIFKSMTKLTIDEFMFFIFGL